MPNYLSSAVITAYFDYLKGRHAGVAAVSAVTNAQTDIGTRVFNFASHTFAVKTIIVFLGDDGIYRTGHIIAVDATTITIAQPVPSTVASGSTIKGVWNGDAHLVTEGYYGLVDHMLDQIDNYDILGDKKIVYSLIRLFRQSTLMGTATRENIALTYDGTADLTLCSPDYPSLKINCLAQSDGIKFKCNLLAGSYKIKSAVLLGTSGGVLTVNIKNGVSILATTSITSYGSTPHVFDILFTLTSNSENIYIEFVQTGTLSWFEVANIEVVEHETSSFNLNNKKHACTGDSWGAPLFDRLQTFFTGCTFLNASEGGRTAGWVNSTFDTNVAPFAPDYIWIFLSHENDFFYGDPPTGIITAIQSVIRKAQAINAKVIIMQPAPALNGVGTVNASRQVLYTGNYIVAEDQDDITFSTISRTYCSESDRVSVTINGTGFEAAQNGGFVKTGTSDLNITSWANTQIVGTTSVKSAGIYDLIIKNNSGNIVSKKDQFSFIKKYGDSKYYRKINRTATYCYDVDENTPFLITENTISDVVSTAARSDGKDIVVTDIYGNLVPRELAVFSKVSGKMQLWTKDPINDIYTGGADLIVQWGGDSVEVANSIAVWSDYQLVAHLEEPSGNYKDSAPLTYSGVTSGSIGYSHEAKIYNGANMPVNAKINFGDVAMYTKLTVSCWERVDLNDTQVVLRKFIDNTHQVQFSHQAGGGSLCTLNAYLINVTTSRRYVSITRDVWNRIDFVYDPALSGDDRLILYINGLPNGTMAPGSVIPSSFPDLSGSNFELGYINTDYPFDGALDEVRISNVAFKAARLKSTYYNENLSSTNGSLDIGSKYDFDTYTVKFVAGANGSLTGDTTQVIGYGGDCSAVTAVPDVQYHFTAWSGDNTSTDNPLTITNVTENIDTTANFAADFTPREALIPTFTPIAGFSLGVSGQLTFNPNSTLGLWLQNPYVLKP